MSKMELLQGDIEQHGEVHAVVEEYDDEIELRRGTTTILESTGTVHVEGPDHELIIDADRIVSWYKPKSLFH